MRWWLSRVVAMEVIRRSLFPLCILKRELTIFVVFVMAENNSFSSGMFQLRTTSLPLGTHHNAFTSHMDCKFLISSVGSKESGDLSLLGLNNLRRVRTMFRNFDQEDKANHVQRPTDLMHL